MRIINPENPDPPLRPAEQEIAEFIPEGFPLRIMKIQRIDILIFLGRIFCVLDRSVRTVKKPLRVFLHIRMIWRTVQGKVESHLHSTVLDFTEQPFKVRKTAKFRFHFAMASSRAADGIGNSRLARRADE